MNVGKIGGSNTFQARVNICEKTLIDKLSPTEKEFQEFKTLVNKAVKVNDNREISLFHGCIYDKDSKGIEYSNYLCGLFSNKSGVRSKLSDIIYKISEFRKDYNSVQDEHAFSNAIIGPLRDLYNIAK